MRIFAIIFFTLCLVAHGSNVRQNAKGKKSGISQTGYRMVVSNPELTAKVALRREIQETDTVYHMLLDYKRRDISVIEGCRIKFVMEDGSVISLTSVNHTDSNSKSMYVEAMDHRPTHPYILERINVTYQVSRQELEILCTTVIRNVTIELEWKNVDVKGNKIQQTLRDLYEKVR